MEAAARQSKTPGQQCAYVAQKIRKVEQKLANLRREESQIREEMDKKRKAMEDIQKQQETATKDLEQLRSEFQALNGGKVTELPDVAPLLKAVQDLAGSLPQSQASEEQQALQGMLKEAIDKLSAWKPPEPKPAATEVGAGAAEDVPPAASADGGAEMVEAMVEGGVVRNDEGSRRKALEMLEAAKRRKTGKSGPC